MRPVALAVLAAVSLTRSRVGGHAGQPGHTNPAGGHASHHHVSGGLGGLSPRSLPPLTSPGRLPVPTPHHPLLLAATGASSALQGLLASPREGSLFTGSPPRILRPLAQTGPDAPGGSPPSPTAHRAALVRGAGMTMPISDLLFRESPPPLFAGEGSCCCLSLAGSRGDNFSFNGTFLKTPLPSLLPRARRRRRPCSASGRVAGARPLPSPPPPA